VSYDARMTSRSFGHEARIVVACLLLGGCGGPQFQPLNRTALRATQPRSIVAANVPVRRFTVDAEASAIGLYGPGMIVAGLAGMIRAGEAEGRLGRRSPIADPALAIRERLLEGLAKRFSLRVVNSGTEATTATRP
jgi:hypothetical protein